MSGKPDADFGITEELVRRLLAEQFPQHASSTLEWVGGGWDNEMYRLGENLAVRLPRRELGAKLIETEQQWLPKLAAGLPIATPAPVAVGRPSRTYPWPFSIVPWIDGETADTMPADAAEVERLAAFFHALHQPAPADAPFNPVRGIPLPALAGRMDKLLSQTAARATLVIEPIVDLWRNGLAAPAGGEACWLHGDLHAQNFIVDDRRIVAVIDWSDMCAGDPATDLVAVWSLFDDAAARRRLLNRVAPDVALLARGAAWAAYFGLLLIESGETNSPRHARQGYALVERLCADSGVLSGSGGTPII